jgi:hypothetical protein
MESVQDINASILNTENEIRELKNKIIDLGLFRICNNNLTINNLKNLEKNPNLKKNIIQASYAVLNQQLASLNNRLTSLEEDRRFTLKNCKY